MDIAGLSMSLCQTDLLNKVSTSVMSMSLDTVEEAGQDMIEALEKSVTPELGQNIDIRC